MITVTQLEIPDVKLIKLKTLPTYYYRPSPPEQPKGRDAYGLSAKDHIYLCPQNLLKFHPDFDPILRSILSRDPRGQLVLLESRTASWSEALRQRFRQTIPDVIDRIRFVPQLEHIPFGRG